jgi:GxxExxY protein
MNEEEIAKLTLDAAFAVHRERGPGLLESVYECAMAVELRRLGLETERQVAIPVFYHGERLEIGFRADLIVAKRVLVELKSVEIIQPIFKKTTLTYLRLIPLRLEFLINFNASLLKDGITRIVHQLPDSSFPSSRPSRASRDLDAVS